MKQKILIILIILWMATIFYLSSENSNKSSETSGKVIEVIVNSIPTNKDLTKAEYNNLIENFQFIIRKTAHFSIYALGGVLFTLLYIEYGVSNKKAFLHSLISCMAYAITDEIHQVFVPGRGPHIIDVMIDSIGSICGSLCIIGIMYIVSFYNKNKIDKKQKIINELKEENNKI